MKDLSLLVFLTQLGLSVALPLAGFVFLGVWLHQSWGWGAWTVWAGIIIGFACAIEGLRSTLKAMTIMAKDQKSKQDPGVSINDHD